MIGFTPVDEFGVEILWRLFQERSPESRISSKGEKLTRKRHREFVINHGYRAWYIISDGGDDVGSIYIGQDNSIGVAILKKYQGRGYAVKAIGYLTRLHDPLPAIPSVRLGHWIANVAPQNGRSARLFKKLGFKLVQHTYAKRT